LLTLEHINVVGRRRHAFCAVSLAAALLLGVTGCGDSGDGGSSTDTKPSASASKSRASESPQDAKKRKALAAYSSFWKEQVAAYAKGSTKGTKVEEFATGEALAQLESDVTRMNARGDRNKGAPKHDAKVSELTPKHDGKVGSATISDCLDISSWKTVDKKSGKVYPLPKEQPRRAITTVKAEDWGKQGWMILKVTPSTTKC
jgi:hypothetical protein